MLTTTSKNQKILSLFLKHDSLRSSEVHKELIKLGDEISLVTVKRELSKMADSSLLTAEKSGRARTYQISVLGRIFSNVNTHEYCSPEPDQRYGLESFNFRLFPEIPANVFAEDELEILGNT